MPRRPATITQADVARVIRAADQAGSGRIVEIAPDGTIRLLPASTPSQVMPHPAIDDDRPIEL